MSYDSDFACMVMVCDDAMAPFCFHAVLARPSTEAKLARGHGSVPSQSLLVMVVVCSVKSVVQRFNQVG